MASEASEPFFHLWASVSKSVSQSVAGVSVLTFLSPMTRSHSPPSHLTLCLHTSWEHMHTTKQSQGPHLVRTHAHNQTVTKSLDFSTVHYSHANQTLNAGALIVQPLPLHCCPIVQHYQTPIHLFLNTWSSAHNITDLAPFCQCFCAYMGRFPQDRNFACFVSL